MASGKYEICQLPTASYNKIFGDYYLGNIHSGILDDLEKELPTDFANSTKYKFIPVN